MNTETSNGGALKIIIETLLVAILGIAGYEYSSRVSRESSNEKADSLAARAAPSSQNNLDEDDQTLVDLPGDAIGFPKDTTVQFYVKGQKIRDALNGILRPIFERTRIGQPWKTIVLHHSGSDGSTVDGIRDWHVRVKGWAAMGYHFIIDRDGTIHVGERWLLQWDGAHCKGVRNTDGIGLCLIGNFDAAPPADAQVVAAAALVELLQFFFDIDDEHVMGHGQCAPTLCPGEHFKPAELIRKIHDSPSLEIADGGP